jgi:hypothetical protein
MPAVASLLAWDVTALHQEMRNKRLQNRWKNDSIKQIQQNSFPLPNKDVG